MEWKRLPSADSADPNGLTALLQRAQREIGGSSLSGTRFLYTSRDMLEQTRAIEAAVLGAPTTLYVGFQEAPRFDREADVYRDLVALGTDVTGFGTGRPTSQTRVRWVELPADPDRLENQWFLVTRHPQPVAFVGFETAAQTGPAGANHDRADHDRAGGDAHRTWEGFTSHDERLVGALIGHLDGVAKLHIPIGSPRR